MNESIRIVDINESARVRVELNSDVDSIIANMLWDYIIKIGYVDDRTGDIEWILDKQFEITVVTSFTTSATTQASP